ncbi:sulfite exporter TauE/SafE family protein [Agrilactobacillus yilanensis]|uniref:Probable membrane transporter protein n=1 Tax=Agrilactobacillus yilanensis TaxID=2485997 RepID=A0ABW4J813_9LACO|nr:sulfite exporter TauE/SafE family protein [Agrilactobacillus yilanensis]
MILVFIVNLIVGVLVGLSGIAGFLLPIFYIGVMHLGTVEALALSFAAFIVSGVLGSLNYYRHKLLDVKTAGIISIGSFFASFLGVKANLLIPEHVMSIILYCVVLFSGISILVRKDKPHQQKAHHNKFVLILIGVITGFICAVTGAGGPILVLPILIMLGIEVHQAVAIALFNSIFIGIPSAGGYLLNSSWMAIRGILPVALVAHGIGVFAGSKNGHRINQQLLKRIVAIFSIVISIIKLIGG